MKVGKGGNMGKVRNKERRKMTEERENSQQNSFNARRENKSKFYAIRSM
jgi:hypothetical protein